MDLVLEGIQDVERGMAAGLMPMAAALWERGLEEETTKYMVEHISKEFWRVLCRNNSGRSHWRILPRTAWGGKNNLITQRGRGRGKKECSGVSGLVKRTKQISQGVYNIERRSRKGGAYTKGSAILKPMNAVTDRQDGGRSRGTADPGAVQGLHARHKTAGPKEEHGPRRSPATGSEHVARDSWRGQDQGKSSLNVAYVMFNKHDMTNLCICKYGGKSRSGKTARTYSVRLRLNSTIPYIDTTSDMLIPAGVSFNYFLVSRWESATRRNNERPVLSKRKNRGDNKRGQDKPGRRLKYMGVRLKSKGKTRWMVKLILRSGDVECNPGPDELEDPTRSREEEPFDDSLGCILWEAPRVEAMKQNRVHFNTVLANKLFKKELTKRLSNALYHCNCDRYRGETNALVCYQAAIRVFCASSRISNEVINLYNQVIRGEKCVICLHSSTGTRASLIQGTTCSDLCEQALLSKFKDCMEDFHNFKIDLVRGWNLMFLNKTEFSLAAAFTARLRYV